MTIDREKLAYSKKAAEAAVASYSECTAEDFERSVDPEQFLAMVAEIERFQEHKRDLIDLREALGFDSWPEAVIGIDLLRYENQAMRESANFRAIQSLRADCEALRKDAERYRWLRRDTVDLEQFNKAAHCAFDGMVDEAMTGEAPKG